MLSKDHFSNKLNCVAGRVATTILQYVAPRVLYAWENPGVPVDEVLKDITHAFHHPALRDDSLEIQRNMFNTVRAWVDAQPDRGSLNHILSSQSVKAGRNHSGNSEKGLEHNHGALGGHGKTAGSIWTEIKSRDLGAMEGNDSAPVNNYNANYNAHASGSSTPAHHPHSPQFGYQNDQRPGSSNYVRPGTGTYLNPMPPQQGGFYGGPQEGSGYQQGPYGGPPPGQYQQQPVYGGSQYQQGPPQPPYPGSGFPDGMGPGYPGQGYQQGPPQSPYPGGPGFPDGPGPGYPGQGYQQGPPPGQYGNQYPPQPPYGGGYGGY